MAAIQLQNDKHMPLVVPGLNNVPICIELSAERCFTHCTNGCKPPPLTVRELAMLHMMNELTDRLDWANQIFDDAISSQWRQEALEIPLVSSQAWDWCITELKDRAETFKCTGRIVTLNTFSGVCKSDSLVPSKLKADLKIGVVPLLTNANRKAIGLRSAGYIEPLVRPNRIIDKQRREPSISDILAYHNALQFQGSLRRAIGRKPGRPFPWRSMHGIPAVHQHVTYHVDPSLFPLVYGRTRVLTNGEVVDLDDFFACAGRGSIAPNYEEIYTTQDTVEMEEGRQSVTSSCTYEAAELEQFSLRFQWLPCEVKFGDSSDVAITSYINNLHPGRFKSLYATIEKLISLAIEPWNDVLVKSSRGRLPPRIMNCGIDWNTKSGDGWPSSQALTELENDKSSKAYKSMVDRVREYLLLPDQCQSSRILESIFLPSDTNSDQSEKGVSCLEAAIKEKWKRLRTWSHPEPGISYTYEEWKAGHIKNANVRCPMAHQVHRQDSDHEFYSISLRDTFGTQGLQVVVKLASLEVTPEQCIDEGSIWSIDGTMNDHIAATAIYFYDVSNLTTAHISFRQKTRMNAKSFGYGEDLSSAFPAVFGMPDTGDLQLAHDFGEDYLFHQEIGSIAIPEGRLLAWPNTLQHKFESVQLIDNSKPGHARFIVMSLVDPHYCVCSTRNVPPQRHDWWAEEALRAAGLVERGIPKEVIDLIQDATENWPIGMDEASALRADMMEEFEEKMSKINPDHERF